MRRWQRSPISPALLLGLVLVARSSLAITDEFDTDPALSPPWELYEPVPGATYATEGGFWRVTLPAGINLDHWVSVDNGIQLRRADIPEDFIIETRVRHAGSGDPENPIEPPVNEPYLANIMVLFSQFDGFHFGPQQGMTQVILQRSGTGWLCAPTETGAQELSLQVKKTGTKYAFSWRASDADPWTLACTQVVLEPALYVGLMLKSWEPVLTLQETFEFDYFSVDAVPPGAPDLDTPCGFPNPDAAWIGMPYVRRVQVTGSPPPDVEVTSGPPGLAYDPFLESVVGWTPGDFGSQTVRVEATNSEGSSFLEWGVDVAAGSLLHDDEFDEDPTTAIGLWELYEPQGGIEYSNISLDDGSTWWRMTVPQAGDQGLSFDTWTTVDRAPQLRTFIDADQDFLIETRVRIDPDDAPPANDEFLSGLLIYFNTFDIIHWNIGQERTINGAATNLFLERSGQNNLAHGRVDGILQGTPVELRIERQCDFYRFFYRGDGEVEWTLAGTYETPDPPLYVGLVMKTWGDGAQFTTDFDYFDFVEPGPRAQFTAAPLTGQEPLVVNVDGSASSSPFGAIISYDWDFGDGASASGAAQSHTYAARGDYKLTLTVTDSTGNKGAASRTVHVDFRTGDVSPWVSEDLGESPPIITGGARPEGASCLRIFAGGKEIGARSDQFHFLHKPLTGDGAVIARLDSVAWPPNARVGVMLREDSSPGSRFAFMCFNNLLTGGKYSFLRREDPDALAKALKTSAETFSLPNAWVKVERQGAEAVGSWSTNGADWTELARGPFAAGDNILAGIACAARDLTSIGTSLEAVICDVRLEGGAPQGATFHRGDADDNGQLQLTDAVRVLGFLFLGGAAPTCLDAGDADDNGQLQLTDAVRVLGFLFLGGPAPAAPGPPGNACGLDTTDDALDCVAYTKC